MVPLNPLGDDGLCSIVRSDDQKIGTYVGTERQRGGTDMAVADQHHKNVQALHNHEQIKQMAHLLVGVLHCRPAAGWVAR